VGWPVKAGIAIAVRDFGINAWVRRCKRVIGIAGIHQIRPRGAQHFLDLLDRLPNWRYVCRVYDSAGNRYGQLRVVMPMARNNSTSNAQRDGRLLDCALASAQIIQFAPPLARKQEQQRLLAPLDRHSPPVVEGDIRAWVAAIVEWSARY
jgi:hypothetical protein